MLLIIKPPAKGRTFGKGLYICISISTKLAGIYIHIPFCRQACSYCNFHFSTSLKNKAGVLDAMHRELAGRTAYLAGAVVHTLYFGGGTPSLLSGGEISGFIRAVAAHYSVAPDAEITLEANPDDLLPHTLQALREAGINRLSIGVQSFADTDLAFTNRAHDAARARQCIADAQAAGFRNITIDLIYGIPGQTDAQWQQNLAEMERLDIPHFSAYALTVEPKTALEKAIRTGKARDVDEDQAARHFLELQQWASQNNYEAYEISNYALPGWRSRHNSAYWGHTHYLGIGPSAHSYNGDSRRWNMASNALYVKQLLAGQPYWETEQLDIYARYNEYIMTRLRTIEGVGLHHITENFGAAFAATALPLLRRYTGQALLEEYEAGQYRLTENGKLLSDGIIAELFITDENNDRRTGK